MQIIETVRTLPLGTVHLTGRALSPREPFAKRHLLTRFKHQNEALICRTVASARQPYLFSIFYAYCIAFNFCAPLHATPPHYAQNFELTEADGYRRLTVRHGPGSENVQDYALVSKSAPIPELPQNTILIRTPVRRVVTMETVYIGYLDALDQLDSIVAAGTTNFITQADVCERVADGRIVSLKVGQSLDVEKLLLLQPDLILTSISGDPAFDVPLSIRRSGLPVLLTAGFLEPSPLARAEWIRCIAALFEADEKANAVFDQVATHYAALCAKTADIAAPPTVFCGAPYSGAWYVPAGESYTARAIRDAGADYLWADHKRTGAIPLDTERVFLKAAHADFWINPSNYRSLNNLFSADPRFAKFMAAQTGHVFNNTRQVGPNGGNAIWERGVVRPDEVLADLIKIFHPNLLPEWDFVFYERLN